MLTGMTIMRDHQIIWVLTPGAKQCIQRRQPSVHRAPEGTVCATKARQIVTTGMDLLDDIDD